MINSQPLSITQQTSACRGVWPCTVKDHFTAAAPSARHPMDELTGLELASWLHLAMEEFQESKSLLSSWSFNSSWGEFAVLRGPLRAIPGHGTPPDRPCQARLDVLGHLEASLGFV